jgi:hypothetical protein
LGWGTVIMLQGHGADASHEADAPRALGEV